MALLYNGDQVQVGGPVSHHPGLRRSLGAAAGGILQAQGGRVHQLQVQAPHERGLAAGEQQQACALALRRGEAGHDLGAGVQAPAGCEVRLSMWDWV